jgi:predicted NUDIX family NTP pyrophosphohydrolase
MDHGPRHLREDGAVTHRRCPACCQVLGPESFRSGELVCAWCIDGLIDISETFRFQSWAWLQWRGKSGQLRMFGEAIP